MKLAVGVMEYSDSGSTAISGWRCDIFYLYIRKTLRIAPLR